MSGWAGRIRLAAGTAVLSVAAAAPVAAQGLTFVVVGETAGDDVSLFLAEGSYHVEGLGWKPVFGLQTYIVDTGENQSVWSIMPNAGLRYRMPDGFFQAKVGYAFKGEGEAGGSSFFGGGEDGIVTSGHLEHWDQGAYGLQGLASYNWGSEYLWSRARGTARVIHGQTSSLHGGVEAGWQGDMGGEEVVAGVTRPNYSAIMVGPVVQWISPNVIGVVGAGWKGIDEDVAPAGEASTWYMKVELVFIP
jgi:hypothetical protein